MIVVATLPCVGCECLTLATHSQRIWRLLEVHAIELEHIRISMVYGGRCPAVPNIALAHIAR